MENKITKELVDRINFLSKKSKTEGLTAAEKEEQQKLREQYLKAFRANFKAQLSNIDVVDEDGNKVDLKKIKTKRQ